MSIGHASDKNFKDEVLQAELPVLVDFLPNNGLDSTNQI